MGKQKTFAERLDEAIKMVKEDNDIVQMSTTEYANGLDKESMKPSQGTVRSPKKEWFGGRPNGKKADDMSKVNSKNTEGGFKK